MLKISTQATQSSKEQDRESRSKSGSRRADLASGATPRVILVLAGLQKLKKRARWQFTPYKGQH